MVWKKWLHRSASALALGVMAVGLWVGIEKPVQAQPAPKAPPTDAEVLESMRKGVHYLLDELAKKNPANNFETRFGADMKPLAGEPWNIWNIGGETGLALYALLHVGQGVTEDEELAGRLKFNSKELAPVVKWLSTVRPDNTYSAGLQSTALAMIPKDTEPYKAAQVAMKAASYYLATAMSNKGSYTYAGPIAGNFPRPRGILEVWRIYWEARQAGRVPDELPRHLEAMSKMASARFGGIDLQGQMVAADMKQREAEAKAAGKPAVVASIQAEMKEYQQLFNRWKALPGDKNAPPGDLSNSQYAILGAWSLVDAEIEMPKGYWELADKFWRLTCHNDGQWPYNPEARDVRPSMTVAGIASVYITTSMVDQTVRLEPKPEPEIDRGIAWLNANFKPNENWYYMYGVERVGLASGLKFFGTINWYKEGARRVIDGQRPNGSWETEGSHMVGTAYALLFLARGRNPVVFNKLEYEGGPWNARPRDNANITAWISKNAEQALNWQVVNMKVSTDEWLDAPVLLITGSKPLKFGKPEIQKLREFVNAGGIIFSTADGAKADFTESIKKIATELVDDGTGKPKYEMRELAKDHPLFSTKNELWKPISPPPRILAMSNGAREIWIHSTIDMGASWQGRKFTATNDYLFPMNLYRYATGKTSPRSKLQLLTIDTAGAPAATRNINLARIDYAGNWDPEPGAWPRLAKIMQRDAKTALKLSTVTFAKLNFNDTPVAHMTGTTGFPVVDADVAALKKFIDAGGTLIVDAAGGSADFKTSFDKLATAAGFAIEEIPTDDKIHDGTMTDSVNTTKADYRLFYRFAVGARVTPQLKGAKAKERWAVIYSGEDITSGLLGTNTYGILGYAPNTAVALARNILLYSASK